MFYVDYVVVDCCLIVLKVFFVEIDYWFNDVLIQKVLESFGYIKLWDYVCMQLNCLEGFGVIWVLEVGLVMVVELFVLGFDYVEWWVLLDGVLKLFLGS